MLRRLLHAPNINKHKQICDEVAALDLQCSQ